MDNSDITDPLFREAVEAIDSGNETTLRQILEKDPQLVSKRLATPDEGYFKHPYLLDANAYIDGSSRSHSHATALHQAVFSTGADLHLKDHIYVGIPLEWVK